MTQARGEGDRITIDTTTGEETASRGVEGTTGTRTTNSFPTSLACFEVGPCQKDISDLGRGQKREAVQCQKHTL